MASNEHSDSAGHKQRTALRRLFLFVAPFLAGVAAGVIIYKRGSPVYTYTAWPGPVKACNDMGNDSLADFSNCGTIDAKGILHLDQKVLHELKFRKEMPECIRVDRAPEIKFFYVDKAGYGIETLQNHTDEAVCDDYSEGEGLVRSPSPEGMRFVDRSLHVIISTPYQYAFRFKDGHAAVCNDLRLFTPLNAEHGDYVGGHCGYIDRRGALVVPMVHDGNDVFAYEPSSDKKGPK